MNLLCLLERLTSFLAVSPLILPLVHLLVALFAEAVAVPGDGDGAGDEFQFATKLNVCSTVQVPFYRLQFGAASAFRDIQYELKTGTDFTGYRNYCINGSTFICLYSSTHALLLHLIFSSASPSIRFPLPPFFSSQTRTTCSSCS